MLRRDFPGNPAMRLPFLELARRRVVVLDGAMGANLQTRTLDLQRDWLGHENISEVLNFSRPDVIQEIHEAFLAVGCDAVETNTFGANKIVLAEADMADRVVREQPRRRARSPGGRATSSRRPTGRGTSSARSARARKLLTLGHDRLGRRCSTATAEQVRGLLAGGVDVLLIETQQDMLAIKCAIAAANRAMAEAGRRVPIMVQASFDTNNGQQMLTGSDPSALVATFLPYDEVDVLGVNCAFGPTELTEARPLHRRELAAARQRAAERGPADHGRRQERTSR